MSVANEDALTSRVNSGIRLKVQFWVPQRDAQNGWWGVVRAGESPDKPAYTTQPAEVFLLPPGQYDVYWKQDFYHQPMLLVSGITLDHAQVAKVQASSGIRLRLAPNARDLDAYYGQWGVVASGGKSNELLNWAKGRSDQPLLVPPGIYDIIWQQDDAHEPESVKQDVTVKEHALIEVGVQPTAGLPPGER